MKRQRLTINEFVKLPENEQFNLLWNEGLFLDFYFEGQKRYVLYAFELFFVEVEYDNKKNKVVGKEAFLTGPKLDRYSNLNL